MALHYTYGMGFFEAMQLELFELVGYKKREPISSKSHLKKTSLPNKQTNPSVSKASAFENFPYTVKVSRKKNLRGIRFRVSTKAQLEISANKSSSEKEILSLLTPHHGWIEKQIREAKLRLKTYPQKKWRTGEVFNWSGGSIELIFSPSSVKKPQIKFAEKSFEYLFPKSWQTLKQNEFQEKLHKYFLQFFKKQASKSLDAKVDFWSKQMKLFPKSVSYRNQKTRWGSCSSDARINLNWKLAAFSIEIQDYVIIHELAHLKHQDHSKKFWNLVEVYSPERKRISKSLQENAFKADPFASTSELYEYNPGL